MEHTGTPEPGHDEAAERQRRTEAKIRRQQGRVEARVRGQQERLAVKMRTQQERVEAKVRGRQDRVVEKVRERHDRANAKVRERQEHLEQRLAEMHERVARHHEHIHARRNRAGHRRGTLTIEQIVAAAIKLADASGTAELSMRGLAAELGAGTMSLYWHVESKEELLALMFNTVIGEVHPSGVPSEDWREDLRRIGTEMRAVMLRHPWAIPLMSQEVDLDKNTVRFADLLLEVLEGAGADPQTTGAAHYAVTDYLAGSLLRERAEAEAQERSGMSAEQWRASVTPYVREVVASGEYPHFGRFVVDGPDIVDAEQRFELGLAFVIDGLAARIEPTKGQRPGSAE